nr:MAG TPA: hypothetical protein [Caudoviricetes sp.]
MKLLRVFQEKLMRICIKYFEIFHMVFFILKLKEFLI